MIIMFRTLLCANILVQVIFAGVPGPPGPDPYGPGVPGGMAGEPGSDGDAPEEISDGGFFQGGWRQYYKGPVYYKGPKSKS